MKETHYDTRFEIDDEGYRKLNEEFTPSEVIQELETNCLDLDEVENIHITIEQDGDNRTKITVEDDGEGYERIHDIFTSFGESIRKGDKTKTGYFDEGQKKVGSLAIWFVVLSKDFEVEFPESGGRIVREELDTSRKGSKFEGVFRWNYEERKKLISNLKRTIVPETNRKGKPLMMFINDEVVFHKDIAKTIRGKLQTRYTENGKVKKPYEETDIEIYESDEGKKSWVYELGVPVQQCPIKFHPDISVNLNIKQKIPQTSQRNVLTLKWLSKLYGVVLLQCHDMLEIRHSIPSNDLGSAWIKDGLNSLEEEDQKKMISLIMETQFENLIIPSNDLGANDMALRDGKVFIPNGFLDRNTRKSLGLQRVSDVYKVSLSTIEIGDNSEYKPVKETIQMRNFANVCKMLAEVTIDTEINVQFINEKDVRALADYSQQTKNLRFNIAYLKGGEDFFAFTGDGKLTEDAIALIIHELAHNLEIKGAMTSHEPKEFADECCRIGSVIYSKSGTIVSRSRRYAGIQ
tara:strand:- start:8364 stop:9917 length:1554 start_codon:yes stop_codon:yes gene_type:complete